MLFVSPKQRKPAPKLPSTGSAAAHVKRCCQDLISSRQQSTQNRSCKTGCSSALKRAQLCPCICSPAWTFMCLIPGPCGCLPLSSCQASLPESSTCPSPHLWVLCPWLEATLLRHTPCSSHQASLPKDSICLSPHLCVLCPRLEATLLQHALPHKVGRHHGHKTLRHHLLQSVIHQRHLQQSSCPFEIDKLAASHLGGCVKVDAVQGLAKLQVVPARCMFLSAQTGKGYCVGFCQGFPRAQLFQHNAAIR